MCERESRVEYREVIRLRRRKKVGVFVAFDATAFCSDEQLKKRRKKSPEQVENKERRTSKPTRELLREN